MNQKAYDEMRAYCGSSNQELAEARLRAQADAATWPQAEFVRIRDEENEACAQIAESLGFKEVARYIRERVK